MFDGKFLLIFIVVIAILSYLIKRAVHYYSEQNDINRKFGNEPLFKP